MTRQEKNQLIDSLAEQLSNSSTIYIADISDLDSENTTKLRALCFKSKVHLQVVKNTLLKKAMDKTEKDFSGLYETLSGSTSMMIADTGNAPARLIKEFRKGGSEKPIFKGAFIQEMIYLGEDQLDTLVTLKSKDELIADLVALLQSPVRNVMSALQSGGNTLTGVLQTLSDKPE